MTYYDKDYEDYYQSLILWYYHGNDTTGTTSILIKASSPSEIIHHQSSINHPTSIIGSNKSTQLLLVLEFGAAWWLNPVGCWIRQFLPSIHPYRRGRHESLCQVTALQSTFPWQVTTKVRNMWTSTNWEGVGGSLRSLCFAVAPS